VPLRADASLKSRQDLLGIAPPQIHSPVIGDIEQIGPNGSCSDTKWCFNQHQTGEHSVNGGVCQANDTYAWDANLNTPTPDSDNGKPVYAVASGTVSQTYGGCLNADVDGSYGQVLIEHSYQGSRWWSGYLHLDKIQVERGQAVTVNTVIGYISHVSPDVIPNHLHFVVYTGQNSQYDLKSFDTQIVPRYGMITPPTVTNGVGATLITSNSSRLNGEITSTGGESPTVRIYFGPSDGSTNPGSWANYAEGRVGLGPFHADISSLAPGTQYYYRCYASNSAGPSWASSTAAFTTNSAASNLVAIQAANGQFVCAEGGGGDGVVANRNAIGAWETFRLIDRGNGNVALQAANGQYVCAEGSGGGAVVANRNAIGAWETFKLIDRGNGNYALQAANGQYVCAEGSGGGAVIANRNSIGAWETFRFLDPRRPAKVALQAANGQYVCAEGSGGGAVVANRNAIGAWETFKLIDRGKGNVALQAANGQYLCAEGSGGGAVVANRNAIGAWETFKDLYRGNGNIALQVANGQYLCAEGSGGDGVVANRNAIGAWETFKLILI